MNYILTEDEYKALTTAAEFGKRSPKTEDLQKLCTLAANHAPADKEHKDDGEPWGCILSEPHTEWYCDGCPVQDICPNQFKEYSK